MVRGPLTRAVMHFDSMRSMSSLCQHVRTIPILSDAACSAVGIGTCRPKRTGGRDVPCMDEPYIWAGWPSERACGLMSQWIGWVRQRCVGGSGGWDGGWAGEANRIQTRRLSPILPTAHSLLCERVHAILV